ncbi:uncharacterized protein DS421_20g695670 [Arachis hypogaea]|nr:uncharacterized protein DS421_20g695670 [Arachis hypogaea]
MREKLKEERPRKKTKSDKLMKTLYQNPNKAFVYPNGAMCFTIFIISLYIYIFLKKK